MENEFVSYTQALALKELGFDEPCFGYYNVTGGISTEEILFQGEVVSVKAPLYQQAFRWFRKKGYRFNIVNDSSDINGNCYYDIWINGQFLIETDYIYITYEEAESACLDKLIEICRNDNTSN